MAQLRCPKCDNLMEVTDEQAGQSISCPHCGNVSVVPVPAQRVQPAGEAAPPPAGQAPAPPAKPFDEKQAHTWGMVCHLAGLALFLGIPFGNIIGPLVGWLIQKDKHPFIDEQGKEAVNFQISMLIYMAVSAVLALVVVGFVLLAGLVIVFLVSVIRAAISANEGRPFRYPITIRFLK